MSKELSILKITNPFDRTKQVREVIEYKKQNIYEIIQSEIPTDVDVKVSLNGGLVPEEKWGMIYPKSGDEVLIIPQVSGGDDDKGWLGVLGMVALFWVAPKIAGWAQTVAGGSTFAYNAAFVGVLYGGGMLLNSLIAPELTTTDFGTDVSQSYGWTPQTLQRQGLVIPKIYGRNKVYGNVIATHTEVTESNDKQILNMLVALGQGPIVGVLDYVDSDNTGENIKINNQPITNFDDITVEQRTGTLDQTVTTFFRETSTETNPNWKINSGTSNARVYSTSNGDFDDLEVELSFPRGIYYYGDDGTLQNHSIGIRIQIKKTTEADAFYQTVVQKNITDNRTGLLKRTYKVSKSYDGGGSGYTVENGNDYDIRVTKTTTDKDDTRYGDDMYLGTVREILNDDFQYPKTALIAIEALATDQLSGSINFSAIVDGAYVRVYNGANWGIEYSNNPAWVLYDILTQPVISGNVTTGFDIERWDGIHPDRIDLNKFYDLAQWCDNQVSGTDQDPSAREPRIRFNGIFDTELTVWEAAQKVCEVARCVLIWQGKNLTLAIDNEKDATQLFSMGNIITGSFKETFLPESERASEIEINFLDEDQDYEKTTFNVFNTNIDNPTNKITLNLMGITSSSEAWRAGYYRLLQNQLLHRTISFDADIDSIAVTIGDVIYFQHDVPQMNQGGRIVEVASDNESVTLDRIPEITDPSDDYQIMIRNSEDTIETRTVVDIRDRTVYVDTAFTNSPAKDDIYAFGHSESIVNEYRVIDISRNTENQATITCIEYNEDVYSVDGDDPFDPAITYVYDSSLIYVTDLRLSEEQNITPEGIVVRNVLVDYNIPTGVAWQKAIIYYKIDGTVNWLRAGETNTNHFSIPGVIPNTKYLVTVVSVDNSEKHTPFDESPQANITTREEGDWEGLLLYVRVTGLSVYDGSTSNWEGKDVHIIWDEAPMSENPSAVEENPSFDFFYDIPLNWIRDYEVSVYNGLSGALLRQIYSPTPYYTYTYEDNTTDNAGTAIRNLRFEVKVRDKYLRISANPAVLNIANPVPALPSNIDVRALSRGFEVTFDPVTETDIEGYIVWARQSFAVFPVPIFEIYRGKDTKIEYFAPALGAYSVMIAAYDSFGSTGLNYSGRYDVNVADLSTASVSLPVMNNIEWISYCNPDDPDGPAETDPSMENNICWTAGTVTYAGTDYTIAAGNTDKLFVCWREGNNDFFTTSNEEIADEADVWVMAINDNGEASEATTNKLINAVRIKARSIWAYHIRTESIRAEHYQELRNTYVYNGDDSLDPTYPFEIPFEIISETTGIVNIRLSFRIMNYRAYSRASSLAGSGNYTTTSAADYDPFTTTGGMTSSVNTGTPSTTNTGSAYSDVRPVSSFEYTGYAYGDGNHRHTLGGHDHDTYAHSHSLNSHRHSMTSHTHTMSDSNAQHTHDVVLSNHTHTLEFGIYEETNSPVITYQIDDVGDGSYGAASANYTTDQREIDITSHFSGTTGWKGIRFNASQRCRIAASIILKLDITA